MRNLLKRVQVVALAATAATALGAVTSAPAHAALSDCPSTYTCAWSSTGFSGAKGQWAGNNTDWRIFPQASCATGNWNDCAASLYNHGTACSVTTYRDINYAGGGVIFWLGSSSSDLHNQLDLWKKISSNAWC